MKKSGENLMLVKAVEEVDLSKAVELVSSPDLDKDELCRLLQDSIMGNLVDKETKEPLKLSNKVVMAGIVNVLKKIERERED